MATIMGLGLIGWVIAFVGGVVVGGVFFMSIKAQVDYVVKQRGADWVGPAAMYARMLFVAAILVMLWKWVPPHGLGAVVLSGVIGVVVSRILIGRMVKRGADDEGAADGGELPQRHRDTEEE